ncbi:MAG: PLDc N-terminal domain-containing protein [Candidatus Nanopelagicales bacterium]
MRFLLYGAVLVLSLYALIDCILTPRDEARFLPKWLWFVVIVVVPVLGPVAWLLGGRPARTKVDAASPAAPTPRTRTRGKRGPVAPDDDPAFLRKLADDEWSRKMREHREHRGEGHDGPAA